MPLGYVKRLLSQTVQGSSCLGVEITAHRAVAARPRYWAPAAYESTLAFGFVDESFGPARALRAVWTAYGQHPCCPQAAHTLGPLAHKLHRPYNKIIERMTQ